MCGIAGLFRFDGAKVEEWRLSAMQKAMVYRGPDGQRLWAQGPAGLAHVRLAIIDLVTGEQPMFNEDGTVVGVFNGEIYNFRSLRAELQTLGHVFATNSDTEVLIHGYEQWGTALVSKLNGMFAFGIYDLRRRRLFVARDRLGVKPLYYYRDRHTFAFASELEALLASDLVPRTIDDKALDLYLHYQYIPAPYSIYQDVYKLSPAEWLEIDLATGQTKTTRYWDIDTTAAPRQSDKVEDWLEELAAVLEDAVEIRLISDVPFGAFLSGGTDSGLTVAMMAGKLSEPVKTFSIGLADGDKDELPYARIVAERYRTQHHEFRVSPEGLMLIPKLCGHFGEPFADSSAVPTYYVSQVAASQVKMVLTGDGGDEMFAGYRTYPALMAQEAEPTHPFQGLSPYGLGRAGSKLQLLWRTARSIGGAIRTWRRRSQTQDHPWYRRHDGSMSHFTLDERRDLLGEGRPLSAQDYWAVHYPYPAADSVVSAAQYIDMKSYLPGDILVKVDRMSMAHSLEVRSPLLDYRIAELAFSMPTKLKLPEPCLDGSKSKFILKELACRYLDRSYVYRPKEGFGIPVSRWLREDKADYLKDTLLSSSSPVYRHLRMEPILRMVRSHLNGAGDYSAKLWNVLMLDGWLRCVHHAPGR